MHAACHPARQFRFSTRLRREGLDIPSKTWVPWCLGIGEGIRTGWRCPAHITIRRLRWCLLGAGHGHLHDESSSARRVLSTLLMVSERASDWGEGIRDLSFEVALKRFGCEVACGLGWARTTASPAMEQRQRGSDQVGTGLKDRGGDALLVQSVSSHHYQYRAPALGTFAPASTTKTSFFLSGVQKYILSLWQKYFSKCATMSFPRLLATREPVPIATLLVQRFSTQKPLFRPAGYRQLPDGFQFQNTPLKCRLLRTKTFASASFPFMESGSKQIENGELKHSRIKLLNSPC